MIVQELLEALEGLHRASQVSICVSGVPDKYNEPTMLIVPVESISTDGYTTIYIEGRLPYAEGEN